MMRAREDSYKAIVKNVVVVEEVEKVKVQQILHCSQCRKGGSQHLTVPEGRQNHNGHT
jgi:hypothetical protein